MKITDIRLRPVVVPMSRPLATAGGAVAEAPLLLYDVETDAGITGSAYSFAYHPWVLDPLTRIAGALAEKLRGEELDPPALQEKLLAVLRLVGWQGLAGQAVSGLDMAAWDALAKDQGKALCRVLGRQPSPIPAYNSKGLGIIGPDKAGAEAAELVDEGFTAIKVRLGYADAAADVAVVRAVRDAVPDDTVLMSDYNQSLSVAEAAARARALDGEGLAWIEEPVRFDDYKGHATVRAAGETPVQTGENCWFIGDMEKCLDAGACDLFMPDAGKIGGVTGWMKAAALAEERDMKLSSHLYPEVSAHLLAATATRHWLEFVDWASPVLAQPVTVVDGTVTAPDRPGNGIEWDEAAVARYAA